jgi:hypothetical protein
MTKSHLAHSLLISSSFSYTLSGKSVWRSAVAVDEKRNEKKKCHSNPIENERKKKEEKIFFVERRKEIRRALYVREKKSQVQPTKETLMDGSCPYSKRMQSAPG